jgi:spermidine/putrescine transport system substrate-binding protein
MNQQTRQQLDTWVARLFDERLTRRDFLQRGATLGIATALLQDILALYSATAAAPGPDPTVLEQIKKEGKRLAVYNWEDYIHPRTIPQFEKEFGVKVTYDTFPGNEQLLAKLQTGGARYDVVFPTHNFLSIHIAQGLLAPLNHENLPNLQNIMAKFLNTPFDPGNTYSAPYGWGTTAIAYNTKYVQDDPQLGSWGLLFQSGPQRYSGKLGFTDEREEVIATALQYLGYDANSRTRDELRQAGELLLRLKPHVKAFYPGADAKKLLIAEDLVVAHSWSGETVKASAKNPAVVWNLPKEGATGWFDSMVIPKTARHKFTAEVFMNYMLRPDVAADNSAMSGNATANRVALEKYVEPGVAHNPAVYPTAEALARVRLLQTIPDDLLPVYEDIWTRLLAA